MSENTEVNLIIQKLTAQISQLVLDNAVLRTRLELLAQHREHEHGHEIDGGSDDEVPEQKPAKKSA